MDRRSRRGVEIFLIAVLIFIPLASLLPLYDCAFCASHLGDTCGFALTKDCDLLHKLRCPFELQEREREREELNRLEWSQQTRPRH